MPEYTTRDFLVIFTYTNEHKNILKLCKVLKAMDKAKEVVKVKNRFEMLKTIVELISSVSCQPFVPGAKGPRCRLTWAAQYSASISLSNYIDMKYDTSKGRMWKLDELYYKVRYVLLFKYYDKYI